MKAQVQITDEIRDLIDRGAVFYVSTSGGKDSQCMYGHLVRLIPHKQIVVVYSDLGRIVWLGTQEHIRATISHELNVVRAGKTLFDMVRHRHRTRPDVPSWPSSAHRQCTSDLKRGPIQKFIRADMKRRKASLAVNCMGLRAQESAFRATRATWSINRSLTAAGRTVYDWSPIHHFTTDQVFHDIRNVFDQEPFWIYASGNERMSCVFCIMGSPNDLAHGKLHRPELYREYAALETECGWTMFPRATLADQAAKASDPNQIPLFPIA